MKKPKVPHEVPPIEEVELKDHVEEGLKGSDVELQLNCDIYGEKMHDPLATYDDVARSTFDGGQQISGGLDMATLNRGSEKMMEDFIGKDLYVEKQHDPGAAGSDTIAAIIQDRIDYATAKVGDGGTIAGTKEMFPGRHVQTFGQFSTNDLISDKSETPATGENKAWLALSEKVAKLESAVSALQNVPPAQSYPGDYGALEAIMVGGEFNCPECGLRINGPSRTSTQGTKSAFYEHPYTESPKLSGKQCRLIGQKFQSPIVRLQFVNPQGLTARTQ